MVSPEFPGSRLRDALRQYPIQHHTFISFLDSAFVIANQTEQSIYDCLYVALAALVKGSMVTADRKLYDILKNGRFKKHVVWVEDVGLDVVGHGCPGGEPRTSNPVRGGILPTMAVWVKAR